MFIMALSDASSPSISWFNLLPIGRFQVDVRIYWVIIIGAFLLGLGCADRWYSPDGLQKALN